MQRTKRQPLAAAMIAGALAAATPFAMAQDASRITTPQPGMPQAQDSASAAGEALSPIARPTTRGSRASESATDGTTFGPATPGSSSSASASATSGADFGPAPPSAAASASDFGPLPPSTATEGSAIGSVSRTESAPNETFTSSTMVGSGVTAADQALMNRVVGALANDPQLKGAMITVQVDGGRVDLSGFAQDETQAARAREVAEGIAGAGRVTGSLDTRS